LVAKVTDGESAMRDRSDRVRLMELADAGLRIGDGTGSGSLVGTSIPGAPAASSVCCDGGSGGVGDGCSGRMLVRSWLGASYSLPPTKQRGAQIGLESAMLRNKKGSSLGFVLAGVYKRRPSCWSGRLVVCRELAGSSKGGLKWLKRDETVPLLLPGAGEESSGCQEGTWMSRAAGSERCTIPHQGGKRRNKSVDGWRAHELTGMRQRLISRLPWLRVDAVHGISITCIALLLRL